MYRQAVLDALPTEVAVLNGAGCILVVNDAWRRFAEENGADPVLRDGVGLNYVAACRGLQGEDAEQAEALADGIAAVLAGRLPCFVREYPCHAPDRQRWFALTAAPLKDPAGGGVVVHFDITERKLAEQAAQRARDSAAQAARVNAVGVLATSLIHELAQPLSAAGFFNATAVSLLEQGAVDPDKLLPVLSGVEGQIQRAAGILQRLREFLRRREMHMQAVAIDAVVAQALGLVGWFAADREVRISYARPAPGVIVVADAVQIAQVLVNLVGNGVQAIATAESARREVEIAVDRHPGTLEIRVRDTGPGLPAEVQARLFEIFASTKDAGLGMGLAISRDIVEMHGGTLWADLDVTEGAVFHFTLPLTQPRGTE